MGCEASLTPSTQAQVVHPLGDVLRTALFVTIADCDDFSGMGIFAQTQLE